MPNKNVERGFEPVVAVTSKGNGVKVSFVGGRVRIEPTGADRMSYMTEDGYDNCDFIEIT